MFHTENTRHAGNINFTIGISLKFQKSVLVDTKEKIFAGRILYIDNVLNKKLPVVMELSVIHRQ